MRVVGAQPVSKTQDVNGATFFSRWTPGMSHYEHVEVLRAAGFSLFGWGGKSGTESEWFSTCHVLAGFVDVI